MTRYILEAQKYVSADPNFAHVGYVNYVFFSREQAGEFYYDQYPWHRSINRDGDWTSDWGLHDDVRYIVIPYNNQDFAVRGDPSDIAIASLMRMNREVHTKYYNRNQYLPPLRCPGYSDR